jgi:ribosomal protein L37AE/L43A
MKEKIIEIIKEKQKEYEFNSSPYNALRELEERIKGLTQPSEKPNAEEIHKAIEDADYEINGGEDIVPAQVYYKYITKAVMEVINQYANTVAEKPSAEECPNCGGKDIKPYKGHYCCYECSEFFEQSTKKPSAEEFFELNEPHNPSVIINGQRVSKKRCIELINQYAKQ